MKKTKVITIGREFCSGGAEIGKKVAAAFGVPFYDKEIIDRAADVLNISKETVSEHDEKPASVWNVRGFPYTSPWYVEDPYLMLPLGVKIAEAQFAAIRSLAEQGPCVITGRCADYVLRERDDVLSVFIRGAEEDRLARCMRLFGVEEADAKKLIRRTDKIRSRYYNDNTSWTWGDPAHYDLVIDAGKLGTDAAAAVIERCVEFWNK